MNPLLLIVDDEPIGRQVLEALLSEQNYDLEFASSGLEALQKARALHPDVVLLDVMMPEMDGFEVCRHLRSDETLAEVPILMVTALDDRQSLLQGLDAGADDFITKPIDRAELRARVRTITRLNRYRRLQEERSNLERQLNRITALRTIDMAIRSSLDLRVTLNILLQQVTTMLDADAADVLLLNNDSNVLEYAAGRGFRDTAIENAVLHLGEGYAGQAALERRPIHIDDTSSPSNQSQPCKLFEIEKFRSYFGVPLIAKGQVCGVLEVFNRYEYKPDPHWLDFLEALGDQAAIAIDNTRMFEAIQRANFELTLAYDATIEGWARALDLRDQETEYHTRRVVEHTLKMAIAASIDESELVHIRRGALLHDVGKLAVPDSILLKAGPLTDQEWAIMRKHTTYAYELISSVAYLRPALDIPYYHHERWDGTGYPVGLAGEQIPLSARLFAVVDVWDALRSDRPYRRAWPEEVVIQFIQDQAGKHFDPYAVKLFLQTIS